MEVLKNKVFKFSLLAAFLCATIFSPAASALDISQESLVVSDQSSTIVIHDAGIGNFRIAPNLEFNRLDDFITYKLVIKNNDGKKYKIVDITDNNSNDAIELSYVYSTAMNVDNKEIELTIKYVRILQNPLKTVTATIKLIDEDDDSQSVPIVVPNTGGNTITSLGSANINHICIIYTILAGVTVVIYIIIRRKYAKKQESPKKYQNCHYERIAAWLSSGHCNCCFV